MKDETRLRWMKVSGALMSGGIIAFLAILFAVESSSGFSPLLLVTVIPAAAIILILVLKIRMLSRGVKEGLPLEDELSKGMKERAGYLAYMVTLYYVLGMMFYHGFLVEDYGFPTLAVRHMMMLTLLFMFAAFCVFWILGKRKMK